MLHTSLHLNVSSNQKDKKSKQCSAWNLNTKNLHLVFKGLVRKMFFLSSIFFTHILENQVANKPISSARLHFD